MEDIFFQAFIDPELWDAAHWRATAFMHDDDDGRAPCLGLVFDNMDAAVKIFSGWRERLGEIDDYEELRISIVECDIAGLGSGYWVHISSDPLHSEARARVNGEKLNFRSAIVVSRMQKMIPEPGSPHLTRFKNEFAKHGCYALIAISSDDLRPEWDLPIAKTEIHFRRASEITEEDPDSVVFPDGFFDKSKPN